MKLSELEGKNYILSVRAGEGIGSEIHADNDMEALTLISGTILTGIKFIDEENRAFAVDSLRKLLDKYEEWSKDPEFNREWEEE